MTLPSRNSLVRSLPPRQLSPLCAKGFCTLYQVPAETSDALQALDGRLPPHSRQNHERTGRRAISSNRRQGQRERQGET